MTLTPLPVKGRGVRVYGFLDGNRVFWGRVVRGGRRTGVWYGAGCGVCGA